MWTSGALISLLMFGWGFWYELGGVGLDGRVNFSWGLGGILMKVDQNAHLQGNEVFLRSTSESDPDAPILGDLEHVANLFRRKFEIFPIGIRWNPTTFTMGSVGKKWFEGVIFQIPWLGVAGIFLFIGLWPWIRTRFTSDA